MNINFTLCVQAFNFLIAYFILRIFLFKPAVVVIDQERTRERGLQEIIKQGVQINQFLLKQNQEQWQIYQKEFFVRTPNIDVSDLFVYQDLASALKPPEIKIDELVRLQDEVAHAIIKKIEQLP